jgi:hypothetical protein
MVSGAVYPRSTLQLLNVTPAAQRNYCALVREMLTLVKGSLYEPLLVRGDDSHCFAQSDKVSGGCSTHLFHELATVDFDRCLASSNFGRYLFVEPTGDNQMQDLPFARCQGFKTFPQNGNFCLSLAAFAVLFQADVNGVQQVLITERLGQEFDGPRFHGAD